MNNITPNPELARVIDVIKNVISDIKIEHTYSSVANLKDGNANINIKQQDTSGNITTINIDDPKDIIFSEDLLPALKKLASTYIVINGLDIETHLIYQDVKDSFDQLSSSYEFLPTAKKEVTKVKSICKFGSHVFTVTVFNETDQILVTPEFASTIDLAIKKIIETDVAKVHKAVNAIYKKK